MYEDEICFENKLFSPSSASITLFDIISVFIFHFSCYWYFIIWASWLLGSLRRSTLFLFYLLISNWSWLFLLVKIIWTTFKGIHFYFFVIFLDSEIMCQHVDSINIHDLLLSNSFSGRSECYRHGLGPQSVPLHSRVAFVNKMCSSVCWHRAPRVPHRLVASHRVQTF